MERVQASMRPYKVTVAQRRQSCVWHVSARWPDNPPALLRAWRYCLHVHLFLFSFSLYINDPQYVDSAALHSVHEHDKVCDVISKYASAFEVRCSESRKRGADRCQCDKLSLF